MRTVVSWDKYFMQLATLVATRSKDPSTQVGAILVDKNRSIVATGYNGFPPGVTDAPERWEKPRKYDLVVHAETNAIGRAARLGHAVYGTTCYTTHFPCLNCAKTLIAAGIEKIVFSHMAPSWEEENKKARALFQEAGVRVELLE